jgi:hypothetical protein
MKSSLSLLILALFAVLAIGAHAQKLCTTREGYVYDGDQVKKIDISKESCGEAACKYECR